MDIGIKEFYDNKSVFITGATGFVGKPLVEKLLRSCDGIKEIFVLIRSKKGLSAKERWNQTTKDELFDKLRNENPTSFEKVKVIDGDVAEEGLGIDDVQLKVLENVNIIIHSAASVRLDDPLKYVINVNVMGTKRIVDFGFTLKHLTCFVHVSTAYSNCYLFSIEEKVYPSVADWKKTCKIIKNTDSSVLDLLTAKYIHPLHNTYVFAKHLAEQVVNDAKDKLPVVIYRPSIVVPTVSDPFPGWFDNFNGPMGFSVAVGKGLVRIAHCDKDKHPDYIPVDYTVKGIIISAWKRTWSTNQIDVYNCARNDPNITNAVVSEVGERTVMSQPFLEMVWYPNMSFYTTSHTYFRIKAIFTNFLMGIVVDTLLRLTKQNPRLLRIHIKVYRALRVLSHFTTNEWNFNNKNFRELGNVPSADKKSFEFSLENIDVSNTIQMATTYGKRVFFNDPDSNLPAARKALFRLYILDLALQCSLMAVACYAFYKFYLHKFI